VHVKFYHFSTS